MANRPRKPCSLPGCGNLTESGRCEVHKKQRKKDRHAFIDRKRKSSAKRGYDRSWRKLRDLFLAKNPLCCECERNGRVELATVVDHIVPHKGNRDLFEDEKNMQPLCKTCHDAKTRRGE